MATNEKIDQNEKEKNRSLWPLIHTEREHEWGILHTSHSCILHLMLRWAVEAKAPEHQVQNI